MSSEFYVVLPSNVQTDLYPNVTGHYTTPLSERISLPDEVYEVGLAAFSYTHSFYNISFPVDNIKTILKTEETDKKTNMTLPTGFYGNAGVVTREFEKLKPPYFRGRFEYDPISEKVRIILAKGESVVMHHHLSILLGLEGTRIFNFHEGTSIGDEKRMFEGKYVADMNPSLSSMSFTLTLCVK